MTLFNVNEQYQLKWCHHKLSSHVEFALDFPDSFDIGIDERSSLLPVFFTKRRENGAATKNLTRDLLITNQLLYLLSYSGTTRILG